MGDIAVTDIDSKGELQSLGLNANCRRELKSNHNGLQVVDDGLADIIRNKSRSSHIETSNLNETSNDDASTFLVSIKNHIISIWIFIQQGINRLLGSTNDSSLIKTNATVAASIPKSNRSGNDYGMKVTPSQRNESINTNRLAIASFYNDFSWLFLRH